MIPASLESIAAVLGARIAGADNGITVRGAAVDSRTVKQGDLFFALKGKIDGAEFVPEAHTCGAVATVADRPLSVPTLVVENPLEAIQDLARWSLSRDEVRDTKVVGITGSVGKTTAKDALAAILRASGRKVCATEGNFNNEIGLPLTVLAAGGQTDTLVLEMGATHVGDVEHLCKIAPPEVGVLTAIQPVHLDSFGSMEALAAGKGELAHTLPENGCMVAPKHVPDSATGYGRNFGRRIIFGGELDDGVNLWTSRIEEHEAGLRFVVHTHEESTEVRAPVFGTHLVEPLLAAFGAALCMGVSLRDCARGISRIKRTGLRGEIYKLRDDILVYDDSYNASPVAVSAVLRYGADQAQRQNRRFVAVLGGMFELGSAARAYHQEVGELANELGVDLLVGVGDEARWYAETFSGSVLLYEDSASASEGLQKALKGGEYVIVKGSRGVGLDRLTRNLKEMLAIA